MQNLELNLAKLAVHQTNTRLVKTNPALSYLQELRQRGLSIAKIAILSGVAERTLYALLAGETLKPSYNTFRRLLIIYCRILIGMTR